MTSLLSDPPELMKPAEVTALLRISPTTVRRYVQVGRLDVVQITPRTFRYRREQVLELLTGGKSKTTASEAINEPEEVLL